MAYIGKSPIIGNFVKLDAITAVNGQAAYTMQNGGANFTDYETVNQFLVSLNGTIQAPTDSFTVSGSTLTFASNLATGDVIDFIMVFGNSLSAGTPTDATVTTAKLADSAVTAAKITDATITAAKLASGTVQNQSAFKNIIINGDMSIAQRGQQTGLATGYTECDRFALYNSGTSVQFTTDQDTSVPSGQNFSSSLKLTLTTADSSITGSNEVQLYQNIEAQNLQSLGFGTSSAKSLVLSFWVKSSVAGNYVLWVYKPDTTGRQIAKLYNIASADTWQKVTFEIPADTDSGATIANDNGTGLSIVWQLAAGSDWTSGTLPTSWENLVNANRYVGQNNTFIGTTNATFFLTGVQLEVGTAASDFEFLPVDVNLNRCKRYFQLVMRGTGSDQPICNGSQHTSSAFYAVTKLDGSMRTAPTMSSSTGTNVYEVIGNSTSTFHSSIDGFQNLSNVFSMRFRIYMNSSGTQGHARWFRMTASADSTKSITASAEL